MNKKIIITDKVRITTYIPKKIHDALMNECQAYERESEFFRRIIFEWLEIQKDKKK